LTRYTRISPEIEKYQHRLTVFSHAVHAFFVFQFVFFSEQRQRSFCLRTGFGMLKVVQIRLHRRGHFLGKTVQHILHLTCGDACISRHCRKFGMPEQYLDHPDIDAAFQWMGRSTMAHRVQRHAFSDPGFSNGFPE
jgi:hypothetical protein